MINIPVSIGELIDKLSILHVKKLKVKNPEKLNLIEKEFELLYNQSAIYLNDSQIENLYHELVQINSNLWEIEDLIRILEKESRFDQEFIELARKVYFTNDERFRCKNMINELTNSDIREVKEYVEYQ